jgi:hypothetical protein
MEKELKSGCKRKADTTLSNGTKRTAAIQEADDEVRRIDNKLLETSINLPAIKDDVLKSTLLKISDAFKHVCRQLSTDEHELLVYIVAKEPEAPLPYVLMQWSGIRMTCPASAILWIVCDHFYEYSWTREEARCLMKLLGDMRPSRGWQNTTGGKTLEYALVLAAGCETVNEIAYALLEFKETNVNLYLHTPALANALRVKRSSNLLLNVLAQYTTSDKILNNPSNHLLLMCDTSTEIEVLLANCVELDGSRMRLIDMQVQLSVIGIGLIHYDLYAYLMLRWKMSPDILSRLETLRAKIQMWCRQAGPVFKKEVSNILCDVLWHIVEHYSFHSSLFRFTRV